MRKDTIHDLAARAREADVSQAEWARTSGVSQAQLSRALNRKVTLKGADLERLRHALMRIVAQREIRLREVLAAEAKTEERRA